MISCAAAKQMRWVKPSMTTVSPSRTKRATASCIDMTFWSPKLSGNPQFCQHFVQNAQTGACVFLVDHKRRSDADGALPATEQEQSLFERVPLDVRHDEVFGFFRLTIFDELDADHEAGAAYVADDVVFALQLAGAVEQHFPDACCVVQQRAFDEVDRRFGCGAAHRIAAEGAAVGSAFPGHD